LTFSTTFGNSHVDRTTTLSINRQLTLV